MRIVLIGILAVLAAALPASAAPSQVGGFQYLVEPDPRACPSPLCGGYWASLANHQRTTCHDGVLRRRCYVALAVGERRNEISTVPAGAIARADLESRKFGQWKLGLLVVADVRKPSGRGPDRSGPYYRIRDLGIRCVRAPCFSFRATRLNRTYRVTVSEVDLAAARLSERDRDRADAALHGPNGLFASGRVVRTADGGRALEISRVYLKVATPRG